MSKIRIDEIADGLNGIAPFSGESVSLGNGIVMTLSDLGVKLQDEIPKWYGQLNTVIGISAFLTATAIAELSNGLWYGIIGFAILLATTYNFSQVNTPIFNLLRKNDKDYSGLVNKALNKNHFSLKHSLINGAVYWMGMLTLGVTLMLKYQEFIAIVKLNK